MKQTTNEPMDYTNTHDWDEAQGRCLNCDATDCSKPCAGKPVTDVIFRVWRKKEYKGDVIALFPTEPSNARGLFMTCYEHVGQHGGAAYMGIIAQTRPAKPAEYADLKKELESEPYNYVLRVCKRQTPQHRREFALTLKAWLTRNQDSSVKSTLAEDSDTKPPKLPKAGDLFRYEGQEKVIAEITSMYHIPSIRFEANGQNQYVAIRALEWDGGMEWWYKKPLVDTPVEASTIMPSQRKFYRTVFQYEVLSEEPYNPDSLEQVAADTREGNCSGMFLGTTSEIVDGQRMANLLEAQGSDPEFFRLTTIGEDIED